MSKNISINRHLAARVLDRLSYTDPTSPLAAPAAALVAEIDAGAGGIAAKVQALLADGWTSTARAVAAADRPADLRRAVAQVKQVAEAEKALGLGAPEVDTDTPADTAPEPVAETPAEEPVEEPSYDAGSYAADSGYSTGYSDAAYGGAR